MWFYSNSKISTNSILYETTKSKVDLLERNSKIVELKREKVKLLAKEAGPIAKNCGIRTICKANAERAKLRDAKLNARIVELERLAKEKAELRSEEVSKQYRRQI